MSEAAGFERACRDAARSLRRMPADLRKESAKEVQARVAEPLAADIRAAASGTWGPAFASTTKARIQVDPTLAVGAARKVVSGGASVNQLVYGAEFGGGSKRTARVTPARRQRGYVRRSTVQFLANRRAFIYPTIRAKSARILEAWVSVLDPYIDRWEAGSDG